MKKRILPLVAGLAFAPLVAYAYDAESYVSAKCGFGMAIPAGHRAQVSEAMGADGFCKVDLKVESVEFHGVTKKSTSVTLAETEQWVVKYTGIAAAKWSKFDEGKTHVGYMTTQGGKTLWAAAIKGASFSCVAFVRADANEPERDLKQFYHSLDCH